MRQDRAEETVDDRKIMRTAMTKEDSGDRRGQETQKWK